MGHPILRPPIDIPDMGADQPVLVRFRYPFMTIEIDGFSIRLYSKDHNAYVEKLPYYGPKVRIQRFEVAWNRLFIDSVRWFRFDYVWFGIEISKLAGRIVENMNKVSVYYEFIHSRKSLSDPVYISKAGEVRPANIDMPISSIIGAVRIDENINFGYSQSWMRWGEDRWSDGHSSMTTKEIGQELKQSIGRYKELLATYQKAYQNLLKYCKRC